MRYGHKSRAHRFDGFKVSVASELSSGLLLDIADVTARGSDGEQLLPTLRRVEFYQGLTVEHILGDGAYGSGENLAGCATYPEHAVDLVTPCRQPADPKVDKTAFKIDLSAETATCPDDQAVAGWSRRDKQGRPILMFTFPRAVCEQCRLFARCVHSKQAGRTVRTSAFEAYLQAQRERQQTDAFKTLYPKRSLVERDQAELVRHGIRKTRYLGSPQRQLQRLWTGAVVNLKRLFRLAETRHADLAAALRLVQPRWAAASLTRVGTMHQP